MTKYIIPAFILSVVFFSIKNKVSVYSVLTDGGAEGLKIIVKIIPAMVIILSSVSMLRVSGAMEAMIRAVSPLFNRLGAPPEIIPMIVMRPISGSGAFGILSDTLNIYGADTRVGRLASVIMGSTETTFYTLAIYFGSVGIKNTKRVVPCALIGDIVGVITACVLIK